MAHSFHHGLISAINSTVFLHREPLWMLKPPKLLISYSHDSAEHGKMVLDLANRFRTEQGIDCQIDPHFLAAYQQNSGMKWMRDQIDQADFVLMLCTPIYRECYERNIKEDGNGVGFESLVTSESLYEKYFKSLKFIPAICDDGNIGHIPPELRGRNIYRAPSDFQTIADFIKGKQYNPLPQLSEISSPHALSQRGTLIPPEQNPVHLPQRETELAYLNSLLEDSNTRFTNNNYITLSGEFQTDQKRVSDLFMPISYHHQSHLKDGETREARHGESTHCDNIITAFDDYKRLVILGEAGAGKTFSLWKIAVDAADKARQNKTLPIPFVIPLNKWTTTGQTLQTFVLEQMGKLAPYFNDLYQQQRILPLLDALNEVPFDQREEKLSQVKEWVSQSFPRLLLSCRERDYDGPLMQELDRLHIEPLDPPRIHDFLTKYFKVIQQGKLKGKETASQLFWQLAGGEPMKQAWERWRDQKPEWKVRLNSTIANNNFYLSKKARLADIPKRINHLWKPYTKPSWENFWEKKRPEDWYWEQQGNFQVRDYFFDDPRCLMKLAQTPYLLNLIIRLYEAKQQLPKSRYQLFDFFVSDLLECEVNDQHKAQAQIPDQQALLSDLRHLAWQLQGQTGEDKARTTMTRSEVTNNRTMSETQLKFAAAANLLELTNDTVRFSHQLLQEYFTAQSLEERISNGLKASELWQPENWWEPNGWEEAAKLAANYEADPSEFLRWLAAGNPRLAVEITRDQSLLNKKDTLFSSYKQNWQAAITNIEQYPNPYERHAISTALAWLEWDERSGIGLNESGLPDIDWLKVPKSNFIYGEKNSEQTLLLDDYEISRFPVTNQQFKAFEKAGGYKTNQWWDGLKKPKNKPEHRWIEGNRPVERVDWHEAIAFCRWLSVQTGDEIRLPTEQEWEKAARGTESNEYPWGNEYFSGAANIDETEGEVGKYYLQATSAVGLYPHSKSPYETLDMSGNVWEWCLNKYDEPEIITPDLLEDSRVVRGGSWFNNTELCHASFRGYGRPRLRGYYRGFRLVRCFSPMTDH